MINNNEVLTRLKTNGKLDAVKYVKLNSAMSLKSAKEYVERLESSNPHFQSPQIGTIEWFKCEDHLPPQKFNDMGRYSDKVLVWGPGGWAQETMYSWAAGEWFAYKGIPFTITHWAYINYPE